MKTERIVRRVRNLLLAFVFITIGFSLGRRTAPVVSSGSGGGTPASGARVMVYAAHMTFRCPNCSRIEALTRELLDSEFAAEQDSGILEFHSVDYLRDPGFARQYDVTSSVVIIARFRNGTVSGFERLDGVWTHLGQRDAFHDYVREAVERSLSLEGLR